MTKRVTSLKYINYNQRGGFEKLSRENGRNISEAWGKLKGPCLKLRAAQLWDEKQEWSYSKGISVLWSRLLSFVVSIMFFKLHYTSPFLGQCYITQIQALLAQVLACMK